MSKSKNTHLSLDDRIAVSKLLDENTSFRSIARTVGAAVSSVSHEVKDRRILKGSLYFGSTRRKLCERLLKAPFVCNGCKMLPSCHKTKYIYDPYKANEDYLDKLRSSRSHIHASDEGIEYLNSLLVPLVKKKKQGVNHIYNSNQIGISKATLYRYIDNGYLEIQNIDLRRKVSYKERKKESEPKRVSPIRTGRRYLDFLAYVKAHPHNRIAELDTVIGKRDEGYCLFTIILRKSHFMIGFFLKKHNATNVVAAFDYLEKTVGRAKFMTMFNICLTDNGSEFDFIDELERSDRSTPRCHLFFCDPGCSGQKGALEKNHEFIRYFLPKGTSFRDLDQKTVCEMFSHINSVRRDDLKGKSPFELLSDSEKKTMKKLGYHEIPPQDVVQDYTELKKLITKK